MCPPSPLRKRPTRLDSLNVTGTPRHRKMFEIFPVNVAADVDIPAHDEYGRMCLLVSLTMVFVHVLGLSSALDT